MFFLFVLCFAADLGILNSCQKCPAWFGLPSLLH